MIAKNVGCIKFLLGNDTVKMDLLSVALLCVTTFYIPGISVSQSQLGNLLTVLPVVAITTGCISI